MSKGNYTRTKKHLEICSKGGKLSPTKFKKGHKVPKEWREVGKKVNTGGFELWLKCMQGDKRAWNKMKEYNKGDVVLLEKIADKLIPWANNTPTNEYGITCPACSSEHVQMRGWYVNRVFKSRRYQCQNCGRWSLSNKRIRHNPEEYLK